MEYPRFHILRPDHFVVSIQASGTISLSIVLQLDLAYGSDPEYVPWSKRHTAYVHPTIMKGSRYNVYINPYY